MMSSILGTIFSGVGAVISIKDVLIDGDTLGEELIRRDEARKRLAGARDRWDKSVALYIHKMQLLRQDLSDANTSVEGTNKALDELRGTLGREPRLEDYYTPSPAMETVQMVVYGLVGVSVGWIGYKVYKYVSKPCVHVK